MAITMQKPRKIFLGGTQNPVIIADVPAGGTITPGHLIERYDAGSGVVKWRVHSTQAGAAAKAVALNWSSMNKGVDDNYTASDLMEAIIAPSGVNLWMIIASGQNIAIGNFLESAGDGTLRIYNAGVRLFQALETIATVTVTTRIRVEAL